MSKKNNLAKRRKQHEFDLQSKTLDSKQFFLLIYIFRLVLIFLSDFFFFLFGKIRREGGKRKEREKAASKEVQDEGGRHPFLCISSSFLCCDITVVSFAPQGFSGLDLGFCKIVSFPFFSFYVFGICFASVISFNSLE